MLRKEVEGRISMEEVVARLGQLNEREAKSIRLQALNQAGKEEEADEELIPQSVQYLPVKMDQELPNFRFFSYIDDTIKRVDRGITRLQAVSS